MRALGDSRRRTSARARGAGPPSDRRRAARGTLVVSLATLFFSLSSASAGYAQSQRDLVAGVIRDWPPEYSLDARGAPTGYAVDVMNAVARRADLHVRYRVFDSFAAAIDALAKGRIDLIPNLGITAQRRQQFAFTTPVETFALALFVRSDAVGINSRADLTGRRVAVVRANAARALLSSQDLVLEVHPSVSRALFDLLSGRVDAMAYPASVLRALAREARVADRIRELSPPIAEIKRALAVRRGEPALRATLNTAVNQLLASPEYRDIYVRWYGEEPGFWSVRRVLWLTALAFSALVLAAVVWRYRTLTRHNRELRARIQERDAAEAALAESEAKYRRIVETTHEGVWAIDDQAVTTFVNRRMAEMLGYVPDAMIGRPLSDFFDETLAETARQNLERRRQGISERHDFVLRHADGRELRVEVSGSPIFDSGEFAGSLAMVSDATEKRQLQARLIQAQKLEAIGRLAGGVAHDFNNLLLIIAASSELARQSLEDAHPAIKDLEQIEEASRRASDLTSQLLAFSRKQVTFARIIDPVVRLAQSRTLLQRLLGEDVELVTPSHSAGSCVSIDPTQFDRLVFNLAANARDAMPDGGTFTISLQDESVDRGQELSAGDYVVLTFEDTGVGMTEEVAQHAFEPFFTTKSSERGTGLGLATCYGIVRQAGGRIAAQALPTGARFVVHLPRRPWCASSEAETTDSAAASVETRRVLLVEDEPGVRRIVQRVLEKSGFEVVVAASPEHALTLFRESSRRIDVLITDVVMPGMNGRELGRRARELDPRLRILYISGYTDRKLTSLSELEERQGFLAKPFSHDALIAAITELG